MLRVPPLPRLSLRGRDGAREKALADLSESLRLAEEVRGKSFGADREHAAAFVGFNEGFELMTAWQLELGHYGEVFVAMERMRLAHYLTNSRRPVPISTEDEPSPRRNVSGGRNPN